MASTVFIYQVFMIIIHSATLCFLEVLVDRHHGGDHGGRHSSTPMGKASDDIIGELFFAVLPILVFCMSNERRRLCVLVSQLELRLLFRL